MSAAVAYGPLHNRTYKVLGQQATELPAAARWPFVVTTRPIANRRAHLVVEARSVWHDGAFICLTATTRCGSRLGSVTVHRETPDDAELCDFCVLAGYAGPCVYRTFDGTGRLLYIGCTTDLFSRFLSHSKSDDEISAWWPLMKTWNYETYASRTEALTAEALAILTERPPYNRDLTDRTRRASRRPAAFANRAALASAVTS